MDSMDGQEFEKPPGGHTVIPVSTQMAAGAIGNSETWLRGKSGVGRKDIRRFVKEYQWMPNWAKKVDLYDYFLERFAEAGPSRWADNCAGDQGIRRRGLCYVYG